MAGGSDRVVVFTVSPWLPNDERYPPMAASGNTMKSTPASLASRASESINA